MPKVRLIHPYGLNRKGTKPAGQGLGEVVRRLEVAPNRLDAWLAVREVLRPHVLDRYGEARESMDRLRRATQAVQSMLRGDLEAVLELASAMGIEYSRAREALSNAHAKHVAKHCQGT